MYDFMTGTIANVRATGVTVEVQDIGYAIATPNPYVFHVGERTKLHLHFHVKEDIQQLYGFSTIEQRDLFRKLLSVTGIGPKSALSIIAACSVQELATAVEEENETLLVKFPGIGKKTARQIILDLKGKLADLGDFGAPSLFNPHVESNAKEQQNLEEAILALKALGYGDREIKTIRPVLEKESLTTDEYIKLALQSLLMSKR